MPSDDMIYVYVVRVNGSAGNACDEIEQAVDEARELLSEAGETDVVTINVKTMTRAQYEAIGDFGGY